MAPKKTAPAKKADAKKPVNVPEPKKKCASGGCCGSIRKLAYFLAFVAFTAAWMSVRCSGSGLDGLLTAVRCPVKSEKVCERLSQQRALVSEAFDKVEEAALGTRGFEGVYAKTKQVFAVIGAKLHEFVYTPLGFVGEELDKQVAREVISFSLVVLVLPLFFLFCPCLFALSVLGFSLAVFAHPAVWGDVVSAIDTAFPFIPVSQNVVGTFYEEWTSGAAKTA